MIESIPTYTFLLSCTLILDRYFAIARNIQPNRQLLFPLPRGGTKRVRCVFRKADLEKIPASPLRSFFFCILFINFMN